jgi:hypothetical protein
MASASRVKLLRQLCTKELSRTVIDDLENVVPVLLCKLEKISHPASSI